MLRGGLPLGLFLLIHEGVIPHQVMGHDPGIIVILTQLEAFMESILTELVVVIIELFQHLEITID